MTNDLKNELKNVLEQDELIFLDSVIAQLQDNHDNIQDRLRKYRETGEDLDLNLLLHELDRVSDRTETMFGLATNLLNTVTENTGKAFHLLT